MSLRLDSNYIPSELRYEPITFFKASDSWLVTGLKVASVFQFYGLFFLIYYQCYIKQEDKSLKARKVEQIQDQIFTDYKRTNLYIDGQNLNQVSDPNALRTSLDQAAMKLESSLGKVKALQLMGGLNQGSYNQVNNLIQEKIHQISPEVFLQKRKNASIHLDTDRGILTGDFDAEVGEPASGELSPVHVHYEYNGQLGEGLATVSDRPAD